MTLTGLIFISALYRRTLRTEINFLYNDILCHYITSAEIQQ